MSQPTTIAGWRDLLATQYAGTNEAKRTEFLAAHDAKPEPEQIAALGDLAKSKFGADGLIIVKDPIKDETLHVSAIKLAGMGASGTALRAARPDGLYPEVPGDSGLVFKAGVYCSQYTDMPTDRTEKLATAGINNGCARARVQAMVILPVVGDRLPDGSMTPTDRHGRATGTWAAFPTEATVHQAWDNSLDRYARQKWDRRVAMRMVTQVTMAAHTLRLEGDANEIVWRDAKPANIVVSENAEIGRLDFGLIDTDIAVAAGTGSSLTRAGTPEYAPKETWFHQGKRDSVGAPINIADPRSDSAAMAAVLHECLTGEDWRPQVRQKMTNGEERDGFLSAERQISCDSGYRPTGDREMDLFIADAAHPDVNQRTPRIGMIARAQAYLDPRDRDIIMSQPQIVEECVDWLCRERQPHEAKTLSLDMKAIQAFVEDKNLPGHLRARLVDQQHSIGLGQPALEAEFLVERAAADRERHAKIIAMFSKPDVAEVSLHQRQHGPGTSIQAAEADARRRSQAKATNSNPDRDRWRQGP